MFKILLLTFIYVSPIFSCEKETVYKDLIVKYDQLVRAIECGRSCLPMVYLLKDDIKSLKEELKNGNC